MKSICVWPGREIMAGNTSKSLDERIAEGENELDNIKNEISHTNTEYFITTKDYEEECLWSKLNACLFKKSLLIKQLYILRCMRDGTIVYKPKKYSGKARKGLCRAWSADPAFDYLLESNHQEFEARGRWEAYNFQDDFDTYRLELFVLLDF